MPSLTVNFSRLEAGFSIWKPAQRYCVYLLMGNQDCAPRLNNLLLLTVSSRCCILSLPQLTTARIYPLELSKGHGGWMKAIFCNQRNGRHRKSLCPGDPQDPAQYLKEVLVPGASLPGYPHIKGISVLLFLLGYSGEKGHWSWKRDVWNYGIVFSQAIEWWSPQLYSEDTPKCSGVWQGGSEVSKVSDDTCKYAVVRKYLWWE